MECCLSMSSYFSREPRSYIIQLCRNLKTVSKRVTIADLVKLPHFIQLWAKINNTRVLLT